MEVVIPSGPGMMEFDFNSRRTSPHLDKLSAPSSPRRFGQYYYTSAPTSPSRISEFYQEFDNLYTMERPAAAGNQKEDDFAFNFSAELERASLSAEELFDGGKIRPLKPPQRLQKPDDDDDDDDDDGQKSPLLSPRTPKSANPFSQGKKIIRDVFSPRNKKKSADLSFAENERGRQMRIDLSSGSRRATRSLSPYRVSEYPWEEEEEEKLHQQRQRQQKQRQQQQQPIKQSSSISKPPPPPPHPHSSSTKSSSRKWRFTDFLLFRSASEGRAADKDPLRKYSGFKRNEDTRPTEGSGSVRRKGPVSAHELHYTKNKAASQDLKKKTFLPYKSGILGFHGFGAFSRS